MLVHIYNVDGNFYVKNNNGGDKYMGSYPCASIIIKKYMSDEEVLNLLPITKEWLKNK